MKGIGLGGERQCPDDLVVRGRLGTLSDLERSALASHLEQCESCRAAAALTMLFGIIPDSQPGDAQMIARVMGKVTRGRRSRRSGWRWAAAAALALACSGAATAAWVVRRSAPGSSTPAPVEHSPNLPKPRLVPTASEAAPEPAAPATAEPEPAPSQRPHMRTPVTTSREKLPAPQPGATEPAQPQPPTAETLFAEANAVRRAGDVPGAINRYQSLRRLFPQSSQARLSALLMGDLFLGSGKPGEAVTAYEAYLRSDPRGSLAEDALFGRARGLGLLGRDADERHTWEELLRRFPRSAYQAAATRRLQVLAP